MPFINSTPRLDWVWDWNGLSASKCSRGGVWRGFRCLNMYIHTLHYPSYVVGCNCNSVPRPSITAVCLHSGFPCQWDASLRQRGHWIEWLQQDQARRACRGGWNQTQLESMESYLAGYLRQASYQSLRDGMESVWMEISIVTAGGFPCDCCLAPARSGQHRDRDLMRSHGYPGHGTPQAGGGRMLGMRCAAKGGDARDYRG